MSSIKNTYFNIPVKNSYFQNPPKQSPNNQKLIRQHSKIKNHINPNPLSLSHLTSPFPNPKPK